MMKLTPHNIVLDIETLSTKPNAAICSIGAVAIDIETVTVRDTFYTNVDWKNSIRRYGRSADRRTQEWWKAQNQEIWEDMQQEQQSLPQMCTAFRTWCKKVKGKDGAISMWGNGAAFDNVIVASAFDACEIPAPWHFRYDRCYRTLKGLYPEIAEPELEEGAVKHHAMHDAMHEARHLCLIIKHMQESGL